MTNYAGTPVTSTGTPSTYTLTVPTGVATWMCGLIAMGSPNSTAYTITTAGSAGSPTFTAIDARAAGNMYVRVLKVTGVKAGDTITITPSAGTSLEIAHFYSDTHDFTAASVQAAVRGSSVSTCTTGSITPASAQVVEVVSLERTTATPTTVSSVTSSGSETVSQIAYNEATGNPAVSVYFGEFTASAASSRTATVTYSGGSGNGYAAAILTSGITAPNPGVPLDYTSATDTISTGAAFYTSATDTLSTPLEMRSVPFGYADVATMLASAGTSTPIYFAHRGGSVDWAEMSMRAYTQAVYWGCGALEISLARTSDGVWFGLHDQYLDRTSGVTGSVDPSTMTWSYLQAHYAISAGQPVGETTQPYMRIEDLVAAYGASHILMIDPKYGLTNLTDLLDLLDDLYGDLSLTTGDRVMLKSYGVSAMTLPTAASGRSIKTWGYFYPADSANYATYVGRWDTLGFDYTGTSGDWSTFMTAASTTPVFGHICPNAAAVTTGTSRGAVGAVVSGVKAAVPRA